MLTSAISEQDSRTVTVWPARRMAIAAPSPPSPAPTTTTCAWFQRCLSWSFVAPTYV
jgi:hypothetical protein